MLQGLSRRKEQTEEGFTLIELMVVVLIIAILLAIAIPTFLGARARAQHRSAQTNIRNALTVERTFFTDNSTYTAAIGSLTAIDPGLNYIAAPAVPGAGTKDVEVVLGAATASVCLTAQSADGNFYVLTDEASGATPGTWYSTVNASTGAICDTEVGVPGTGTPLGGGW